MAEYAYPLFKGPAHILLEDCRSVLSLRGSKKPAKNDPKSQVSAHAFKVIAEFERESRRLLFFRIRDNIEHVSREVKHARSETIKKKWADLLDNIKSGFTPTEMNTSIVAFCDTYLSPANMARLEDMADALDHERLVIERCVAREDIIECLETIDQIVVKFPEQNYYVKELKLKIAELYRILNEAEHNGLRDFWSLFGAVDDQLTNAIHTQASQHKQELFDVIRKSKMFRIITSPYTNVAVAMLSISANAMQFHSYFASELPSQLSIAVSEETRAAISGALSVMSGNSSDQINTLQIPHELDPLKMLPSRSRDNSQDQ